MKIALFFLSISVFFQTAAMAAPACQNFSGSWEGVCTLKDGTKGNATLLNIAQSSCDQIQIETNLFELGVPKIVKQETTTNPDGTVTTETQTTSLNWDNDEQTRLLQVTNAKSESGGLTINVYLYDFYLMSGENFIVWNFNSDVKCVYSKK